MTNCKIVEVLLSAMALTPDAREDMKSKRVMVHYGVSPERYAQIKEAISLLYGEESASKFAYQVESYSRGFVTKMFLRQGTNPLKVMRLAIPEAYKELQNENAIAQMPEKKAEVTTSPMLKIAS